MRSDTSTLPCTARSYRLLISFLSTLLGREGQQTHSSLYWEYHSDGGSQAVRLDDWKAVRTHVKNHPDAAIELYNLRSDEGELTNVAAQHPDIVAKAREIMATRTRSPVAKWNF